MLTFAFSLIEFVLFFGTLKLIQRQVAITKQSLHHQSKRRKACIDRSSQTLCVKNKYSLLTRSTVQLDSAHFVVTLNKTNASQQDINDGFITSKNSNAEDVVKLNAASGTASKNDWPLQTEVEFDCNRAVASQLSDDEDALLDTLLNNNDALKESFYYDNSVVDPAELRPTMVERKHVADLSNTKHTFSSKNRSKIPFSGQVHGDSVQFDQFAATSSTRRQKRNDDNESVMHGFLDGNDDDDDDEVALDALLAL